MRLKIKLLIFQEGEMDEEVEIEQEFPNLTDILEALKHFAARESAMSLKPQVLEIWSDGPKINLPASKQGYGPMTNLVIKEITPV